MTRNRSESHEIPALLRSSRRILLLLAVLMAAGPIHGLAQTCNRYVDQAATGAEDGTSWQDAYTHLQDALDEANAASGVHFSVCIATGVYLPDADKDGDHVDDDVTESFRFVADNVQLYGGYPSGGGSRDPQANPTVLSGDIDENDTVNAAGITVIPSDIAGDNARHVIELVGGDGTPITSNTRIDGVHVTAGDNSFDNDGNDQGAGMQCNLTGSGAECSPRIVRVVFQGNVAYSGGAVNIVLSDGATASPRFDNVVFRNNSAANVGGAVHVDTSGSATSADPVFVNVLFSGNHLDEAYRGGAYDGSAQNPLFVNTVFVNSTDDVAVYNYQASGGALNEPTFENCIFWSNDGAITDNGATSTVNHSIVQGGWTGNGAGNLNQDPQFVDSLGPDGIAGTADDDLRLQGANSPGGASPAIDAGDNGALVVDATDLDGDGDTAEFTPVDLFGNERVSPVYSTDVDMGVHEFVDRLFADRFESS